MWTGISLVSKTISAIKFLSKYGLYRSISLPNRKLYTQGYHKRSIILSVPLLQVGLQNLWWNMTLGWIPNRKIKKKTLQKWCGFWRAVDNVSVFVRKTKWQIKLKTIITWRRIVQVSTRLLLEVIYIGQGMKTTAIERRLKGRFLNIR